MSGKKGKKTKEPAAPAAPAATTLEDLLKRRYFLSSAFSIYGGTAGLYDFGPPGCALKSNMLDIWRKHFVVEENMLEVDTPCVVPEIVLQTSGHVERFTDLMVIDLKTGEFFRADKVATAFIDQLLADATLPAERREELQNARAQIECLSAEELHAFFQKEHIKSEARNEFSEPRPFNLMFATSIGPSGALKAFLRPETAQGIFVNFRRLLEFNQQKMPFAGACIGQAFRNEIAPRQGLIRLREFQMAEIEHFVDPEDKSHPKFKDCAEYELTLFSKESQVTDREHRTMKLGDAVAQGVIGNETLGYFMARTQMFMQKIGIDMKRFRFRQHLSHEMAHYATDCWDAEIFMSGDWVECVGLADRACFDLTRHLERSKVDLVATRYYDPPIVEEQLIRKIVKGPMGKALRKNAQTAAAYLEGLSDPEAASLAERLAAEEGVEVTLPNNETVTLTSAMFSVERRIVKVTNKKYIPHVVEPSFGVGRVLMGLLEHAFYVRESDNTRGVLAFKPCVAPVKCSILPLSTTAAFEPFVKSIAAAFAARGISHKVDDSGVSVGKRYARTDEIGIPFGVTVDFQTVDDGTVTLRERDSMKQLRMAPDDVVRVIFEMSEGHMTWEEVAQQFPEFVGQVTEGSSAANQ